ncbi:hypothetical protein [Verrucosispora sioxanthis]|uniref:hypothetical protein n=1 Tax=Verrucosispora sioxanthis TaxID=2499994 RepID=UPI001C1137EC|nr:hypothetical protein [Verrucosispora sioxanthis]
MPMTLWMPIESPSDATGRAPTSKRLPPGPALPVPTDAEVPEPRTPSRPAGAAASAAARTVVIPIARMIPGRVLLVGTDVTRALLIEAGRFRWASYIDQFDPLSCVSVHRQLNG